MPAINGYSPVASGGHRPPLNGRPHPLVEHAAECLDDDHLTALADSALMAAAVLFGAGVVGTVVAGLVVKRLVESLR